MRGKAAIAALVIGLALGALVPARISAEDLPGAADAGAAAGGGTEGVTGSGDRLEEARRAEAGGRRTEALRLYRAWLAGHPRSPAVADVLGEALRLEQSPKEAARLLLATLAADPPGRVEILRRDGGILEVAGRVEEAAALYRSTAGDPQLALRLAALLVAQGEGKEALAVLEPLRAPPAGAGAAADAPRAELLRGRALRLEGREGEAEAAFRAAAPAAPGAALELFLLLEGRPGRTGADEALAALEARFPGSPEAAIARGVREGKAAAGVERAVDPAGLLGGPAAPGAPAGTPPDGTPPGGAAAGAAPAAAAAVAAVPPAAVRPAAARPDAVPTAAVLVQTGSFTVEENAEYMVRDLHRAGYSARIQKRELNGKSFFRVVVEPEGGGSAAAQGLLLKLKNAGFEGFLLFPD